MQLEWFKAVVGKGLQVIRLDRVAMRDLASEPRVLRYALVVVAIGGLASALGHMQAALLLFYPFLALLVFFVNVAILHVMAGAVFRGTGRLIQLMQVLGAASVINWIGIVPGIGYVLGFAASLWFLVVSVVVLEEVYRLDRGKAVLSVILPFLIVSMMAVLFGVLGSGAHMGS